MAHRILWAVAVVLAALALVAGCFAPSRPLVVVGTGSSRPPPPPPSQVRAMDKPALENEVMRLVGENDSLRLEVDKLKRENKSIKSERDHYEDQAEELMDQLKKARGR
jgi:FtsZ-binding cell division protein ZapB